jgi:tryptophanyl-tRNA synthetase
MSRRWPFHPEPVAHGGAERSSIAWSRRAGRPRRPRRGSPPARASLDSTAVSAPADMPQQSETPKPERRPRVFSGSQPSGTLHLGNYLGAIRNYVAMQETHDCIYCVVDLHAITVRQQRAELRRNTIDVANAYLACGVDPERSIVFVQSHVPAHTELMWILNTITYMGELRRMTQYKDKTADAEGESIAVGLFDYPVLMAADILLYRADAVPVGEDQKQHVELTRDVAERFNNAFGKAFVVPEPIIRTEGARVMSLDDPAKKMSKSAGSENSFIALMDPPDVIRRKIRRAVTDSGGEVRGGPDKPALTNLLDIFSSLTGDPVDEIVRRYDGKGYADLKADLGEVLVSALAPIQGRIRELEDDTSYTLNVLHAGAERAEAIAERTLAKVRERVGLVVRP